MTKNLKQDIAYAARRLSKSPAFTIVAVMTLALGIGANTAIFSVLNTTLFRSLPYPAANRLIHISEQKAGGDLPVSYPDFLDWKRQQNSFSALTIYRTANPVNLRTGGSTDRLSTVMVDRDFLRVLGVQPMLGRDLSPDDDRPEAAPALLLPYATWAKRFGGDPEVVGRAVQVDGKTATIVGVLPSSFQFFNDADLVLPLAPYVAQFYMENRESHSNARVLGRLKEGVSPAAAAGEMNTIAAHLAGQFPKSNAGVGAHTVDLRQYLMGDAKQQQLLLMGAVVLVLLIVCVNIATLSLSRSFAREREMSIRVALGARRPYLIRQLMVESLLLSAIGGGLGVFLAAGLSAALNALVPHQLLQFGGGSISVLNLPVLLFAFGATALTGIGFGFVPAWQLSKANPSDALKDRSAMPKSFRGRFNSSDLMIAAQVGGATLLLITAGLVLRSLWALSDSPLGYETENVLTLRLASPGARVNNAPLRIAAFYLNAVQRLAQVPGVEAAAATSDLPFGGNDSHNPFRLLDRPAPALNDYPVAPYRIVTSDYFRALGIPLLQGRVFDGTEPMPVLASETPTTDQTLEALRRLPVSVIVSHSFAQHWWPGQNPVGKGILLGSPAREMAHCTVIGVVGDSTQDSLGQTKHEEYYLSLRQFPFFGEYSLLLRAHGDPALLIESARKQIKQMTATEAVYDVRPLSTRIAETISAQSFQSKLISAFAALALVLATVGLYGILAFNVGRRTREIGIRIALGASLNSVICNVFLRGFAMVVPGVVLGLTGSWAIGRYLRNQLHGISTTDPRTFAVCTAALILSAFFACWFPARRAAKVDPLVALRDE